MSESETDDDEVLVEEQMTQIIEGLWLGLRDAAMDTTALRGAGISHALSAGICWYRRKITDEITRNFIRTDPDRQPPDRESILRLLHEPLEWIDEGLEAGGIIVHAEDNDDEGYSAPVVVAWLMSRRAMKLDEAIRFVSNLRPTAVVEEEQALRLKLWERSKWFPGLPKYGAWPIDDLWNGYPRKRRPAGKPSEWGDWDAWVEPPPRPDPPHVARYELAKGEKVKITGLSAKPELNDRVAEVVGYIEATERFEVMVDDVSYSLKRANLKKATSASKQSASGAA